MKIQRFLENNVNTNLNIDDLITIIEQAKKEEMKYYHLLRIANTQLNYHLLRIANTQLRKLDSNKKELYPLFEKYLKDYILLNPFILDDQSEIEDIKNETRNGIKIKDMDLGTSDDDYLAIEFNIDFTDSLIVNFNKKQLQDFVTFIKDPDLYQNAKKYNL